MRSMSTPQTRCRAGFARADITPPVGIYHRMWGAALHDRATGVHRRLTATALWLDSIGGGEPLVVIGVDHCILDRTEFEGIITAVSEAVKCVRCWHHRPDVGIDPAHPEICGRCVENVAEQGEDRRWF